MGYNLGCCGVWGVILGDEHVGSDLRLYVRGLMEYHGDPEKLDDGNVRAKETFELAAMHVAKKMSERGIVAPAGCTLHYTGDQEDCPGCCGVDPDTILFGIGMMKPPWEWPNVDDSWKKVATLHTWVWGG